MKKTVTIILLSPILLWFTMPAALAADSAINTMIEIATSLNHYPGSGEKQKLTHIIRNDQSTPGEKSLAEAMLRIQHSVQGDDIATLQTLASNSDAGRYEQTLAKILLDINHQPSTNDKRRLQALAKEVAGSP